MSTQNSGGSGRRPPTSGQFVPGDPRINRGGRPPGMSRRIRELAGEEGEGLVDIAWKIAKGRLKIKKPTAGGIERLPPTAKERLEAVEWLGKHGYGEPPKRVELTGNDGGPVDVQVWDLTGLSDEELELIERLQGRMAAQSGSIAEGEGPPSEGTPSE